MPEPGEEGAKPEETETPAPAGEKPADDGLPEGVRAVLAKERTARENAEREAKKAAKERDALAEEKRQREEAALTEQERTAKTATAEKERADKAEMALRSERIERHVERTASKLSFYDPDDAFRLIDHAAIEFDEDGKPTNVEPLLTALLKAKPHLAKVEEAAAEPLKVGVPATPKGANLQAVTAAQQEDHRKTFASEFHRMIR